MTEREILPTVITTQAVAVPTEQRSSLVARGLKVFQEPKSTDELCNSQDEIYRKARCVLNLEKDKWNENDDPDYCIVYKSLQKLEKNNYGKAYYSLHLFHRLRQDTSDEGDKSTQHYLQLAVDWSFAHKSSQDSELWCDLGQMLKNGVCVQQNFEEAFYWFRKAAGNGCARAQRYLGWMFDFGKGVSQDKEEAIKWYRLAAEQGHSGAQHKLGWMYGHGQGVPQDLTAAVKWYRMAAEQGDARAQEALMKLGIDWKK